ncbi:peramine synthetase [Colletotrichum spaethianum]|uniref:Peramine synthetase n=1 Tax=Colletotrichum spaethianum TaxID=700344 RepID=A0AA37LE19_9PEZI|nr:peramine synthetase [Colletotrichum spaethianum]GKT44703.1 peramine synthetase [Colletotrichum spaethianum]
MNDGTMVYVGRKDMQVKINGQRIELGDIESNLAVCFGVKRGVILFPSHGPFSRQLVAVLEVETGNKTAAEHPKMTVSFSEKVDNIQRELATKIPSVMLPKHWVDVDTLVHNGFPLSASGKADRKQIITCLEAQPEREPNSIDEPVQVFEGATAILPGETPAYELAEKIASLVSSKSSSTPTLSTSFNNVLLHASGLDSLNMMSLMHFAHMRYRIKISMQLLMDEKTSIRTLAAFITDSTRRQNDMTSPPSPKFNGRVDIMAQVNRYDKKLLQLSRRYHKSEVHHSYKKDNDIKVFLTGGNGYLGTQILRQLLERRDVSCVTTLVRSTNTQAAKIRVIEAARKALWWTEFHESKLEVWVGDLSESQLGLEQEQWDLLSDGYSFDVIIHNGATVHWNKSYSALEPVNVGSTAQLLGLAVRYQSLRFAYVSGGRQWRSDTERDEDIAHELADSMGYSQTKFVAEVLVKRAAGRCSPTRRNIAVFRPGLIIGTPTEGVANLDDYIWRITSASIDIGAYNADDEEAWLHVSDAAETAAAAINAALNPNLQANVVKNQEDGMTWGMFWGLIQASGYDVRPITASEWFPAVRKDISERQEAHPLWPLAHLLDDDSMKWDIHIDHPRDCPVQLKVAVKKNLEFLMQVRFLPAVGMTLKPNVGPGVRFQRSGFK